jgi:hypothetical protein
MRYKDLDLVAAMHVRGGVTDVKPMYRIVIQFFKDQRPIIDHQHENVDRVLYLASEWIKQPKTEAVKVYNPAGREVFAYNVYDHI